jgi:hypothetical protein
MRPSLVSVVVAALVATTACSSQYMPRARGRVSVMIRGGAYAYARDGQIYHHGFLGSGLERAVAGNPAAEQAAGEYRSRLKTGMLVGLGGLACSAVAVSLAVRHLEDDDSNDRGGRAEAWVALGCLALSMGGFGYLITAEPYRWDAINIFNDDPLPTPQLPGAPGGPPGAISRRDAITTLEFER